MLRIGRLTVENLTKECVTDNPRPRFSYYLESDRENVSLKSAVIRMNGWSTVTEDQVAVPYGGPELEPFTRYTVTVHVTDDAGETAEARMDFETGRLHTPW
ncbi:MAG: alpha-L-rhamnosidase, partial [Hungatella sp.]